MPSLSSLLATGLFPPSPIAQWPPPPNTVCPEAISGLSERQRFDHWLPVRVVFDADLARTLDANLRDAVAQAEAAAIAAGRETDIISAETAEEVRTCLQDASKRLPSYRENQIQARFNSVVDAALLLVDPLHNLFDEPVPPALIVDGPADIPSVLIQPDALPGDELFERKLRLEADVLVREEERNPSDLAGHGIWLTMEVKVPEAQRPPGQGSAGGIHQRLETFLRSNPDVAIDQIETAILDEPARTELLKQIATARICGNQHLFFIDGIKFAVGRLVSHPNGSYTAIISPFHPIVPAPPDASEPSVTRAILATLCPFIIKPVDAERALPSTVEPIAATLHANTTTSDGRGISANVPGQGLPGSSSRASLGASQGAFSRVSTFRIVYPDHHAVTAERFSFSAEHSSETGVADSEMPTFVLSWLITKGSGGIVYGGRDHCGDRVVLKVALPGLEPALQDEYEIGRHLRGFENDAKAPYLLLKTSGGRVAAVSRYAGESPEEWEDLERDVRISLFVSLARVHQHAHVKHNDIAPRNAVVLTDANKSASARWIDWSEAKTGHECGGGSCTELLLAAAQMGLWRMDDSRRTSAASLAGHTGSVESRAVVFSEHGDPTRVLRAHRYRLPKLDKGQVRLRFELGAINPADINVIQGVYPSKPAMRDDIGPEPVSIMGNEGVATVEGIEEDGTVEHKLKVGDRVVMGAPQLGTWQSHANLPFTSLIPLPASSPLSLRQAATLAINPPTAWRMLSDFVPLNPEDPSALTKQGKKQWVIQNGANSAVGVAVIQLAKAWGVGTINLVRSRPSIDELKSHLESLGADHVLTYDEFLSRENNTRSKIKEWIGKDGEMRLALNCVGGKETAEMCKLLALDGKLVTYGGMAKTALALPPSLFIFRKLTSTGFWLSNWVQTHPKERQTMMQSLAALVSSGKLKEPETEVVELKGTDREVTQQLSDLMKKMEEGRGKKTLLHWNDE